MIYASLILATGFPSWLLNSSTQVGERKTKHQKTCTEVTGKTELSRDADCQKKEHEKPNCLKLLQLSLHNNSKENEFAWFQSMPKYFIISKN